MNLAEQIRSQARKDSRRFSRGVHCRIVSDSFTLQIINSWRLLPQNINLDFKSPGTENWYSNPTGHFLALPIDSVQQFEQLRTVVKSSSKEILTTLAKEYDATAVDSLALSQTPLVDFLRQKLILVTCPRSNFPDGTIIDPIAYDVVVDTLDVGLGKSCSFIPRSIKISDSSILQTWNE